MSQKQKTAVASAAMILLALFVSSMASTTEPWAYTCSVHAPCCDASKECPPDYGCTCTYTCPPGAPANCQCDCIDPGGGGGCSGTCHGQICCQGPSIEVADVSLTNALAELTKKTNIKFSAPWLGPQSRVTLSVPSAPFGQWVHSLAKQMNAVPIYRGAERVIEFVPVGEVNRQKYSEHEVKELFSVGFTSLDAGGAVRLIAGAGKIDILIPEKLGGDLIDGDFTGMGWRGALDELLKSTGYHGQIVVQPNGLVKIVP